MIVVLNSLIPLNDDRYEDNGVPKVNQMHLLFYFLSGSTCLVAFFTALTYQNYVACKDIWIPGLRFKIASMLLASFVIITCVIITCGYVSMYFKVDMFYFYELPAFCTILFCLVCIDVPLASYISSHIKRAVKKGSNNTLVENNENKSLRARGGESRKEGKTFFHFSL